MIQQELAFDPPAARASDPDTSHLAAVVQINRAAGGRLKAMAALIAAERPLSDFDLADVTGLQQTSIGVRRGELVKAGLACRAFYLDPETCEELPMSGTSPSGARVALWEPTPSGRDWFAAQGERA